MPFRFALAPLLRLRQSIERQRTLQLQEASMKVVRAQEALNRLDEFLSDSAQSDSTNLAGGRSGAELQFASVFRDNLHRYREELEEEVQKLEAARRLAVNAYRLAYRAREVLETLSARQQRAYQEEQMRREQRELDAAYLLQRW